VFCEGEAALYRSEEGESQDGRDQTCFVKEKQRCVRVRKGSHGMVEIKLLCFVKEKRRCIGVRRGSHGMVEIEHVL